MEVKTIFLSSFSLVYKLKSKHEKDLNNLKYRNSLELLEMAMEQYEVVN